MKKLFQKREQVSDKTIRNYLSRFFINQKTKK